MALACDHDDAQGQSFGGIGHLVYRGGSQGDTAYHPPKYMESYVPRLRERVCLQDGLKLDLNRLARKGFVRRGANISAYEELHGHIHIGMKSQQA